MANPLFNRLFGGSDASAANGGQTYQPPVQTLSMPRQMPNMDMQTAMSQLRSNPVQMIRQAGYNVPDEIANNPQATVMHLIQSGQVGGPIMQRIQPMLNSLMGRR